MPNTVEILNEFAKEQALPADFSFYAQKWFTPLLMRIIKHKNGADKPLFIGINGCQGSGKSTLSALLTKLIAAQHNLNAVCLSLDDFYYDQTNRNRLSKEVHPLFKTRGVPGTHDNVLLHSTLDALNNGKPCVLPSFDKSTDNPKPKKKWNRVNTKQDIIIFEGWCWGIRSQSETELQTDVNKLEKTFDESGVWRRTVNDNLKKYYEPLYSLFDVWVMLKAPSFESVFNWRCEQEHKLIEKNPSAPNVMSDQQIAEFIQYYQRLTKHGLKTLSQECDYLFELDNNRQIIRSNL